MSAVCSAGSRLRRSIPVIGNSVVHVGRGLLELIPSELTPANGVRASKFVIVSDTNVWPLYGQRLVNAFLQAVEGCKLAPCASPGGEIADVDPGDTLLLTFQVPAGEKSKSRSAKSSIEDFMLAHHCNRDTCMIALGGGVVGDLVGFVAATYMRGIPVVQVPTSSTAMIDSSVGGKTAINVPAGKNLIGAFHQPVAVYVDMDLLATLGKRELVEGIAEAIKMGCIRIPSLFELLEANPERVIALDEDLIEQVIYESIRGKAEVVAQDEREKGLRSTLNWGHTIGHAVEALKSPAMMHGECVAAGCVAEAELSHRLGNAATLTRAKIKRIAACFESYGLPVHVPTGLPVDAMMRKMAADKKNRGGSIRCTIVTDIGRSVAQPQAVEKALMCDVIADSMSAGGALPAWNPIGGGGEHTSACGPMAA